MTFDYGKIDIAIQRILSSMEPDVIILFGSAAREDASENSDIDLMIIMDTDDTVETSIDARLAIGPIGVPVDVLVYTPKEIQERSENIHSVVHDAVTEGKILYRKGHRTLR